VDEATSPHRRIDEPREKGAPPRTSHIQLKSSSPIAPPCQCSTWNIPRKNCCKQRCKRVLGFLRKTYFLEVNRVYNSCVYKEVGFN